MMHKIQSFNPPVWMHADGTVLACVEKIKVLNENLAELRDLVQDAVDDCVLMGATQLTPVFQPLNTHSP